VAAHSHVRGSTVIRNDQMNESHVRSFCRSALTPGVSSSHSQQSFVTSTLQIFRVDICVTLEPLDSFLSVSNELHAEVK
jgi:hypothetical protein